jgi:hypothetical protein
MKRLLSWALVAVMVALPASASADQPIDRSPEYWYAYASKLPIGATVQVRTTDGKRQTAILAIVDTEGITLESKTRIPEPPRRIRYDDVEQLALKKNGGSVAKAVAVGAGIGAGTFVGLLMLLAANWD